MPKSILIVDDYEQVRKIVRDFLERETGFEVCGEAVDGYDAVQKAQELRPDLIILDMSMPRMTGMVAAPALKKLLPQIPILLLTSYQAALKGFDVRAVGIDAVVPKGGQMSLLADRVQSLLQEVR